MIYIVDVKYSSYINEYYMHGTPDPWIIILIKQHEKNVVLKSNVRNHP